MNNRDMDAPSISEQIKELIKDYESAKIKTTVEFAQLLFNLGYNEHLKLMNKALSSHNIFMEK